MALDQQRNWTISMAENLDKSKRSFAPHAAKDELDVKDRTEATVKKSASRSAQEDGHRAWSGSPIHLPDEIIIQILEYISHSRHCQPTLASCCLLSHQWYDASVPLLYRHPQLYGKNFDPFVRAICPSINLHVRKSPLAHLVRRLDMGSLVHQGSKSMTARLLGRTKGNLQAFVAPVASFGHNCLPALSKCQTLTHLDLSLVSESPPLPDLFKSISHLALLTSLRLPRSSGFGVHHSASTLSLTCWPPNLLDLTISGGIDAHFLHGVVALPTTLRHLSISHCPLAKGHAVTHLLRTAVAPLPQLESLKIAHMPRLSSHALDDVLFLLPQIRRLSVSVDYVTPAMFDEGHFNHFKDPYIVGQQGAVAFPAPMEPLRHNELEVLELTNSGNPGVEDKISPIDIMIAIDEGSLPKLKVVRVAKSLLWHSSATASDAEALADALQDGCRNDQDARASEVGLDGYEKAGVWQFDG